jgi:ribosomal protein S18 acetylase RimI-like enzyme
MHIRPATAADVPALTDLFGRHDTAWFGAVEESEKEIADRLGSVEDLATNTALVFDGEGLLGAAMRWRTDTTLIVAPDIDPHPVYDQLVPWLAAGTPSHVEVLGRDDALREYLEARGWRHRRSSFELFGKVDDTLHLDRPLRPDGITVRGFGPDDAAAVHHLIYVDAGWADVPGHHYRELTEWRSIFLGDWFRPDEQVLAWRGERLVGVALTRHWDDGTGWISQLATARDERRHGLGRALLLQALATLVAAGASQLGLSVLAQNRGALGLYRSVGLEIDREWMQFTPTND